MLLGKGVQAHLQKSKRRAQFVRGIAGKLTLCRKGNMQAVKHIVKRIRNRTKFDERIRADMHVLKIGQLHLFNLVRKVFQRSQRTATHKIGNDAAEQGYAGRHIPIGKGKPRLCLINDNRQILFAAQALWIKGRLRRFPRF